MPGIFASTSRISRASQTKNCRTLKTSRTVPCFATIVSMLSRTFPSTSPLMNTRQWPYLARNTASASESSRSGDFSTELCGGTHTRATGEIGLIKILSEGSVSSGVRRMEAVTGEASLRHFRKDHQLEHVVSGLVGRRGELSPADALRQEIDRRDEELKKLRRELEQTRMKSAGAGVASADQHVREVKGIKVLAHRSDNLDRPQLRTLMDNLRNKIGSGVVVLGSVADGKVAIIVGVTKDLTDRVQAGKVVGQVAQKVGGKGGGRPDLAEAGGTEPESLDSALSESYAVVEGLLK